MILAPRPTPAGASGQRRRLRVCQMLTRLAPVPSLCNIITFLFRLATGWHGRFEFLGFCRRRLVEDLAPVIREPQAPLLHMRCGDAFAALSFLELFLLGVPPLARGRRLGVLPWRCGPSLGHRRHIALP